LGGGVVSIQTRLVTGCCCWRCAGLSLCVCVCVAVVPGRFRVPQARWGGGEGGEKKGGVEKRKGGGETKKGSRRRRTAVHDKKSCDCKWPYFARVYKGDGGTKRRGGGDHVVARRLPLGHAHQQQTLFRPAQPLPSHVLSLSVIALLALSPPRVAPTSGYRCAP
jgi:hypothetical protein